MSLFKKKKQPVAAPVAMMANYSGLAELTLNNITDGVILIDANGTIVFANPAATTMVGYGSPTNVVGLNYQVVLRLENSDGAEVPPEQTKLTYAVKTNAALTTREYYLVSAQSERKAAISLTLTPTGGPKDSKIITFRDIAKELEEEQEQSEFISTASHEMRTPVASIEGYLGLALNPQTATIDARAKQYLEAAHQASQHLGRLFKDLLDVTKLDDGRAKMRLVPVEIVTVVKEMAATHEKEMVAKNLKYSFGTTATVKRDRQIEQLVYAAVDLDFLREILDNLIENAIKYTPEGGEIWVNARGDGDKVVINVTDTGIGVSPEDAGHVFQKFYRVDNSQTRQIGGTGLGLHLVKQRVEAMDGRVWVESAFGEGSTFFVSLPRISDSEYEKRMIAYQNEQARLQYIQASKAQAGVVTQTDAGTGVQNVINTMTAQGTSQTIQPQASTNTVGTAGAAPQAIPAENRTAPTATQLTPAPAVAQPTPVPQKSTQAASSEMSAEEKAARVAQLSRMAQQVAQQNAAQQATMPQTTIQPTGPIPGAAVQNPGTQNQVPFSVGDQYNR